MSNFFSEDFGTKKQHTVIENKPVAESSAILSSDVSAEIKAKGDAFADEIRDTFITNLEKESDRMAHVSTFMVIDGIVYSSYYANTETQYEDPTKQTARLTYFPLDNVENKTHLDMQTVGDTCLGREVELVYDTVLMRKDEDTLVILWTAKVAGNYYRLFRTFKISTKELGEAQVNRFKVGEITNDFSTTGIQDALAENGLSYKPMYSDIGIMQKISTRVEDGKTWYYSGAYSGDFTCIIKTLDFETWEYVSGPDFANESQWENATYVIGDKVFYFVRQHVESKYGYLTAYDLINKKWEKPVLIEDCQSRGDFIVYEGDLYLIHAPVDREHLGIVKVDTKDISRSEIVLQAKMHTSCFYPFMQYFEDGELGLSYTVNREHVKLARFTLKKYL